MDRSDEQLVNQLKESLMGGEYKTAFAQNDGADGRAAEAAQDDNPLETDFFRALNAFRAARNAGDPDAMAQAERHLQDVVRGELTGESCDA